MPFANRRYQVVFHFHPPQKPTPPYLVKAKSMADALAQAETALLESQEISLVGPRFPRNVIVARVGNWGTGEQKSTAGES